MNQCSSDGLFVSSQIFNVGVGACKSSAWLEEPQRPFTAQLKWNKKCNMLEAPCPTTGKCGTRETAEMTISNMNDDWLPLGSGPDSAPPLIDGLVGYDSSVANFMYKNTKDSLVLFEYNFDGSPPSCDSSDLCCADDPQDCLTDDMKSFLDDKMKQ